MAKERTEVGGDLIRVRIDNPLSGQLRKFPKEVREAIKGVVRDTSDTVFQRIKDATPRDSGTAARGWQTDEVREEGGQTSRVMTNQVPYINVLEFGGYPVIRKGRKRTNATGPGISRGNATLGGYPPGPRTQEAVPPEVLEGGSPVMNSNVSKQAPSGMVREQLTLIQNRFAFDLEEAIDKAFNELT